MLQKDGSTEGKRNEKDGDISRRRGVAGSGMSKTRSRGSLPGEHLA